MGENGIERGKGEGVEFILLLLPGTTARERGKRKRKLKKCQINAKQENKKKRKKREKKKKTKKGRKRMLHFSNFSPPTLLPAPSSGEGGVRRGKGGRRLLSLGLL